MEIDAVSENIAPTAAKVRPSQRELCSQKLQPSCEFYRLPSVKPPLVTGTRAWRRTPQ